MSTFDYHLILGELTRNEVVYPDLPAGQGEVEVSESGTATNEGFPDVLILRDTQGNIRAYAYEGSGYCWMHWPDQVTFRFDRQGNQVEVFEETKQDKDYLQDLFWRNVVPFVLQAQGWEALHASAVITPNGVVAFCASSGTGKSTLAYGLAQRGYALWSDDAVVFKSQDNTIMTYPLHFQLRLLEDAREFYKIDPRDGNRSRKQVVLDNLNTVSQPQVLSKIFILERNTDSNPGMGIKIERSNASEGIQLLLSHAYCFSFFQKSDRRRLLQNYFELLSHVPVFHGRLTPGLDNMVMKLDSIETAIL